MSREKQTVEDQSGAKESKGRLYLDVGGRTRVTLLLPLQERRCYRCRLMSSLRVLTLRNISLNGSLPNQGWCELSNLQELDLSENGFTGMLPTCLGDLTSIRILDLSFNQFIGNLTSSPLSNLTTLEYLILSYNHSETPISFISFCNHSKHKVFLGDNNKLSDTIEFQKWIPKFQLEVFSLSNCGSSNLGKFQDSISIPPLEALGISKNHMSGKLPRWMGNMSNLMGIAMFSNHFEGPIPVEFCKLGATPDRKAQFATFEESSYEGNLFLCGLPLRTNCNKTVPTSTMSKGLERKIEDGGFIDMEVFYVSFLVSYIIALLGIVAILFINPHWRQAWFHLVEVCMTSCLNWQHQLCKNPRPNPDIKTLFTDHTCASSNGARAPPPTNNPLAGPVPRAGVFPPIGAHIPFQPVVSPAASAIAGWMSNANPSMPHAAVAPGPPGLVQPPGAGVAFSRTLFRYLLTIAGELRQHLEIDAHVGGVNDIAFAHPNKQLCIVTCGDDKTIKFIFSTAIDGKIKAWLYDFLESRVDYDAPGLWCTAMAYSADGTRSYFSQNPVLTSAFLFFCLLHLNYMESAHGLEVAEIEFSGDDNEELSLIKFRVVNPLLGEWISLYCKALTNLSLRVFYGMSNLNITSSCLQDMKITIHDEVCDVKISAAKLRTLFVGGRMGYGGGFRTGKSFTIFAPNLQEFKYVGDLVYISCKGEFKSLEIAIVIVSDYPLVKAVIDSFIKFFCCLSKARKMELSDRFIKMLCNQDCAPAMSLESLRHLTIHDGPYKDSFRVPLLASFLKSSPNLRYLRMRYNGSTNCQGTKGINFNGRMTTDVIISEEIILLQSVLIPGKEVTTVYTEWVSVSSKAMDDRRATQNCWCSVEGRYISLLVEKTRILVGIIMGRKRKPDHPRRMMSDVVHNRTSVAPPLEEASHRPASEGPLVPPASEGPLPPYRPPSVAPQQLPCTRPPRLPSVRPPSMAPQQLSSSAYEPSADPSSSSQPTSGHVSSSSISTRRGRGCAKGDNVAKLTTQLGIIVRNGNIVPLTFVDWNSVPDDIVDAIWKDVKDNLNICPEEYKPICMRNCNSIWKDYKNKIKTKYFRPRSSDPNMKDDVPLHIKIASRNANNRRAHSIAHTTGRTTFSQIRHEMTSKGESTDKMNVWLMTRRVDDPEDEFNRQLSMLSEDGRTLEAKNAIFHELIGHDGHGYCRTYGRIVPRRAVHKDGAGPSQSTPQPSTIDQITQKVRAELRDELREELRVEFSTHLQQMRAEMMALVSQGASVDPNRQVPDASSGHWAFREFARDENPYTPPPEDQVPDALSGHRAFRKSAEDENPYTPPPEDQRFLHLRNGADLFRLRIDYPFFYRNLNYDMDYRIVTWMYNATMCRVQELDLDIALKNTFCLPLCALNCSSLRVLKLNLNWGNLKLPNVEFNSLQELSLIKFRVVNPLLGEWISLYCKALTNLSLRVFYGMSNLNITSSSLQDMKITIHDEVCDVKISAAKLRTLFVGGRMGYGGGFRTGKSLTIFAPNLQEFKYVGDLVYISCKGEFKSLEIAIVIVSDYPLVKAVIDSFIKFFCCLSKARKMELSDRFIKMLCNQDCAPTMSLEN
ncbi:hypothetical protein TEA_017588 [Camellia sinensis var. sinensis]|uniref:TOPLESS zinc finger domain-containing protein n=1 Tax=Camellia sinensis var. sinensis TaxID=542762 RepID=A0A4S4F0F5_CAMSN|nr:hypothetical protein TEA_017588 [Camellia sinensis var. sinensis]